MKIGIDLRFLGWDYYSDFVKNLVIKLTSIDSENSYRVYLHEDSKIGLDSSVEVIYTNIKIGTLAEQTQFGKILKKDDNHLMIFFNFWKPISYKWEYFVFIPTLKNMFYQNFISGFEKWKYLTMISHCIKHASKILVFDEISKQELWERFNVSEDNIFLIPGAFRNQPQLDDIKLDLWITWWIKNPYLIYPGWWSIEKNLERLAQVLFKIRESGKNIDLVILWDNASSNVGLRNKIIEHNLQQNIFFIGNIAPRQRHLLYKQSKWMIYPSLYETFSFDLTDALHLNIPIIASNLPSLKRVLGESISYFSPISSTSMVEQILSFFETKNESNFSSILGKYTIENSAKELLQVIKL